MIVGIDGRALLAGRGIGRHCHEMSSALSACPTVDRVRAFVPGSGQVRAPEGAEIVRSRLPSRAAHGLAAVARRPTLRSRLAADVVWLPAPAPVLPGSPYVLTVHDLSWIERPQDFTHYERFWHHMARFEAQLSDAAQVISVSASVAEALQSRFGVSATVIEPGVSVLPASAPFQNDRPYFLYVGALEPRKGLDVLEEAWLIAKPDADLLIAGIGRSAPRVGRLLGAVDDDQLARLYAGALAVVLPSRLEGFGFPPREASAYGVPSIVSDLPALRIPGTLRVPVGDPQALADALFALPDMRTELVAELAPSRPWSAAASELAAVLEEACR